MTSITKMHGIMNIKYMIEFDLQMMRSGGIETNWECCIVDCIKILERSTITQ